MIEKIVEEMSTLIDNLKESITMDIEDIKKAKHEELLKRNDEKHLMLDRISELKIELNRNLMREIENGVDVNIYREKVDELEEKLKELYILNKKLASIVLPIQQMYKDLVEEISNSNGGQVFDLKA